MAGTKEWTSVATAGRYRPLDGRWYMPESEQPGPGKDAEIVELLREIGSKAVQSTPPTRVIMPPGTLAAPIQEWVRRINEDCASFSSPKAIRKHRLYKHIVAQGRDKSLRGVLSALRKFPMTASVIAEDIVGRKESPVQDRNDFGDITRIAELWTKWGMQQGLLR